MVGILPVLKNPLFRRYIMGNGISLLGAWVQRVGIGWLTWELTHSGFWLGAIAFADLFPALIIGPFAGVWADRYDRRNILLLNQLVAAMIATVLFVLISIGAINIYGLFVLSLGLGITSSIALPARLALVPMLVKSQDVPAAVALNSVLFNTARFVGPMIAASLIAWSDVSWVFLVNGFTYAVMAVVMYTIPSGLHTVKVAGDSHILTEIWEGVRYAGDHKIIRAIMLIILAVAVFSKPVAELLPGFADGVFGKGAVGLALMTQAMGVGALLGGICLAQFNNTARLPTIVLGGFLSCGITGCLFGMSNNFTLSLVVLLFMGMAVSVTGICTQTLIQHSVKEEVRGRVMSLWGLIFRGAPALGVIIMGALSDLSSLGSVVLGSSIFCLVAATVAYLRWFSRLRQAFA